MKRIEEFTLEGRNFIYLDLSGLKTTSDLTELTEAVKPVIAKCPANSLYTITNIANFKIDSEKKDIMIDYLAHNEPYVKYGAVIGIDGIKKLMAGSILKISGRSNMLFAFSKEKAIELLMQK